jgi:Cytochrome D1 heme domain
MGLGALGAAAAALLLGLAVSGDEPALRVDGEPVELVLHCRNHDGRWLLAVREQPPTLLLFDAEQRLTRTWPVTSRNGQAVSRVAAIVDATTRRSFVVALKDIAELWEISYDPRAEDFYDGLVHDFRMGEGVPTRGFLNPRRIASIDPLETLHFDPVSTEVFGTSGAMLHWVNLDVRRRVASRPLAGSQFTGPAATPCR